MTLTQLEELEKLAAVVSPGPYTVSHRCCDLPDGIDVDTVIALNEDFLGSYVVGLRRPGRGDFYAVDAEYFARLDPATVLELVRLARKSLESE